MRLPPGWARDMPRRRVYARCPLVGLDPRNYSAPDEAEFYSKKQRGGAGGVSPLLCVEIISDNKQRTGTTASNSRGRPPPARAESDQSLPRLGEQRGGPPAVLAVIREAKEVKCHAHTDHE
jgi:hypothetical protein